VNKLERGKVKDLEFLVLADLAYERFDEIKDIRPLKEVFSGKKFNDKKRKQRWEFFSERMEGWKLLEGFDLSRYKGEYEDKPEGIKSQYEGFYAAAFEKDDEIVIAYRGTDKEVGGKESKWNLFKEFAYTNGQIVCGMPGIQFKLAEEFYNKILDSPKLRNKNKTINITGHSLGGGLAQYVAVIGAEKIAKTVVWNGVGVAGFSRMNGYELFGENAIFNKMKLDEMSKGTGAKSNEILKGLINGGYVKLNGTYLTNPNTEFVDLPNHLEKIPTKEKLKDIINEGFEEYMQLNKSLNYWDKKQKSDIEKSVIITDESLEYSRELLEIKKIRCRKVS